MAMVKLSGAKDFGEIQKNHSFIYFITIILTSTLQPQSFSERQKKKKAYLFKYYSNLQSKPMNACPVSFNNTTPLISVEQICNLGLHNLRETTPLEFSC